MFGSRKLHRNQKNFAAHSQIEADGDFCIG